MHTGAIQITHQPGDGQLVQQQHLIQQLQLHCTQQKSLSKEVLQELLMQVCSSLVSSPTLFQNFYAVRLFMPVFSPWAVLLHAKPCCSLLYSTYLLLVPLCIYLMQQHMLHHSEHNVIRQPWLLA